MSSGLLLLLIIYIYVQIMFIFFIAACLIKKYKPTMFCGFFQQSDEDKEESGDLRINISTAWPLTIIALIIYGFWYVFHTLSIAFDQD